MDIVKGSFSWGSSLASRPKTTYIVLHHAAAKKCTVQDIHRWHLNNGWSGIGYQFFVDKQGQIFEGRPLYTMGAQCAGFNDCSIGICAEGDFMTESMTDSQKIAIAQLLQYVKGVYPHAVIMGHKELKPTDCPGDKFPLKELKQYQSVLDEVEQMDEVKKSLAQIAEDVKSLQQKNKVYKGLNDIPAWYRVAVDTAIQKGILSGTGNGELNLSEDMCRILTVLNRAGVI